LLHSHFPIDQLLSLKGGFLQQHSGLSVEA